jgi:hypothetical protein
VRKYTPGKTSYLHKVPGLSDSNTWTESVSWLPGLLIELVGLFTTVTSTQEKQFKRRKDLFWLSFSPWAAGSIVSGLRWGITIVVAGVCDKGDCSPLGNQEAEKERECVCVQAYASGLPPPSPFIAFRFQPIARCCLHSGQIFPIS